ncbi:hypothetical protein [Pedobacter sp. HMWF019]|uniref:hypothetical protein n=1 Tax=Pedobacter sp. HMWF019 TaxID=2056856 RepID=UPI0011B20A86|nr:hypothetical protein [Pedobacter sp. HMWF019]
MPRQRNIHSYLTLQPYLHLHQSASKNALKLNANTPSPETLNHARIDEWQLCRESTNSITLDTSFELSIAPAKSRTSKTSPYL